MIMKYINEINIKNKKVLIRVDYNIPIENGKILNDFRLRKSIETIKYCLSQNCSVILMSHLGRPDSQDEKFSLEPIVDFLDETFKVFIHFSDDCISDESLNISNKLLPNEIHLLENLRFYNNELENDHLFAKKLSEHADIFVNDAFGTSHRKHASNSAIMNYFKVKSFGFLIKKEFKYLSEAISKTSKHVLIVGGLKVSSKIKLIENFLDKTSHILIGGAMAFTFLKAKGINVGNSFVENDMLEVAKNILDISKSKNINLVLPVDVVCANNLNSKSRVCNVNDIKKDECGFDIGPETSLIFEMFLNDAKSIIWNGPLGAFEYPDFATSSQSISSIVKNATINNEAVSIIGGGDTVSAIEEYGSIDGYTHVSTGGGASLKLLSGETLEIINSWNEYEK